MRNEGSVEIDRPIDEVFRLANDEVAEWSIVVVEDQVIEKKPEGVGTTFRTVTEENGKRMEFEGVVTQYDPPHASAVRMTGKMFDMDVDYTFEDLAGRTRVTQRSNVTGKGLVKVFLTLFGWLMNKSSCKALEKELNSLKEYCERNGRPSGES
jgi:carbon monoxide dehydrogenase subunit G